MSEITSVVVGSVPLMAVIFGLALGLVTSGFYDFADSRLPKVNP